MKPRFCPHSHCDLHNPKHPGLQKAWYVHNGSHMTKVVGAVPRYRCQACRRTFSDRTFSIDYYTKITIPYDQVFSRLSSSESLSSIARNLAVHAPAIQNRLDRLSRSALALHDRLEKPLTLQEYLVADGFESFEVSQFFPNNINILVGKESQYLYGFTHTTIRRKGKMTREQKEKRKEVEKRYRAPRGGIESSFAELLGGIPLLWNELRLPTLSLLTDEHPSYHRAVSHVHELIAAGIHGRFSHLRFPSTLTRTVHNPLFPVNYYERELRKDIAAYHRESTCFCRNTANGLSRFAVYQAWHNFVKPYRVKRSGKRLGPHGEYAGIDREEICLEFPRLFCERIFLSHLNLRGDRLRVWMKRAMTPMKRKAEYLPKYACA
jgi:transposase-like protein